MILRSRNKQQTAERESAYFDSHPDRGCVIVVGDKPGDADVNHGVAPDERCLKIGFFDHSHEHPHPDLPPMPPPSTATPTTTAVGRDGEPERMLRVDPRQEPAGVVPQEFVPQEVDPQVGAFSSALLSPVGVIDPQQGDIVTPHEFLRNNSGPDEKADDDDDDDDEVRVVNPGEKRLGFLGESLSLEYAVGAAAAPTTASSAYSARTAALSSQATDRRITGRPESQGGGDIFMSGGGSRGGSLSPLSSSSQKNAERTTILRRVADRVVRSIVPLAAISRRMAATTLLAGDDAAGGEKALSRQKNLAEEKMAVDNMMRAYGDSFDVVAHGGHSMDLVADFVRHLIGELD